MIVSANAPKMMRIRDGSARADDIRPYAGCGADSPGNVVMVGASYRVVEDADPYDGIIQNRM